MDGRARIPSTMSLYSRRRIFVRAVLLIGVILGLGSASQTPPVGAAPAAQGIVVGVEDKYEIVVVTPEDPICAGQDYPIYLEWRLSRAYPGFGGAPLGEGPVPTIPGLKVRAVSNQPSIGTINPELKEFYYIMVEEVSPTAIGFIFQAKKRGITRIWFQAVVPANWTGTNEVEILNTNPPIFMEVLNCSYEVSMKYKAVIKGSPSFGYISPLTSRGGIKPTKIKLNEETNKWEGDAIVNFSWLQKKYGTCPGMNGRVQHNTTHITAELKNGLLLLHFDSPWMTSWGVPRECVGDYIYNNSMDLSRWGDRTSFPEQGGILSFDPWTDHNMWLMISVKPTKQ